MTKEVHEIVEPKLTLIFNIAEAHSMQIHTTTTYDLRGAPK